MRRRTRRMRRGEGREEERKGEEKQSRYWEKMFVVRI
jgi:hypothetical protein